MGLQHSVNRSTSQLMKPNVSTGGLSGVSGRINDTISWLGEVMGFQLYVLLAVPGMRCNASRKPPFRSTSHEVR
jgi:hypothetical protein